MKEVTAYRCDYCKKLYMRSGTCANHEELCLKNPQNIPLCYTCQHFILSFNSKGYCGRTTCLTYY